MPARALSRCCAPARHGRETDNTIRERRRVAGECGNRTHPTLLRRVTVILKITEATRLHPPPGVSFDFDRNFSPFGDFPDFRAARDARKIVARTGATHANEKPTRRLRIVKNRPILFGASAPADEVAQVFAVAFGAVGYETAANRFTHAGQQRNRV